MTQSPGQSSGCNRPNQSAMSPTDASALLQGITTGPGIINNPNFSHPAHANTQTPSGSSSQQSSTSRPELPGGLPLPTNTQLQTPNQDAPQTNASVSTPDSARQGTTEPPTSSNPGVPDDATQNPPSRMYTQAEVDLLLQRISAPESANRRPLIASSEDIENARALARATAEAAKEKPLPNPIEGFKEDPLNNPVSEHIDEAVKANKYVPLSAIANHTKHYMPDDEEVIMMKDGTWKAKPIDRRGEKSLPFNEWYAAAQTLVSRIRVHHGNLRADKMEKHFANTASVFNTHNMAIAYAYDIRQRELACRNPLHDIAPLDTASLNLITSAALAASSDRFDNMQAPQNGSYRQPPNQLYLSAKRKSASFDQSTSPSKRKPQHCFRCGGPGHVISACTEPGTKAGIPCAVVAKRGKDSTLVAPSGKLYCFRWARESSCHFEAKCYGYHACSICGDASHGAARCDKI